MNYECKFKLGDKVKDSITGFMGVVTTITFHLNGCVQCGVTPKKDKDGKFPDSVDLDWQVLEKIGRTKRVRKSNTGGAPKVRPANIR